MAREDRDQWRKDLGLKQAQWMQSQCARCPVCGALVCGDVQKDNHRDWHIDYNDKLDNARNAVQDLQGRLTTLEGNFQTAQTQLQNTRNRVTTLETNYTTLAARVSALEVRLPPV